MILLVLTALPCGLRAGEDADFQKARYLHSVQEFKLAVEAAEKYLTANPNSERAGDARLLLADSCYQLKDYAKAAPEFERFIALQPKSPHRPQAFQRAVKAFFLSQVYERSMTLADTFLTEYRPALNKPDALPALPALVEDVLYYAGESAYAKKDHAKARAYWNELRTAFPKSKLLPDASEGLAWIAYDAGQFADALPLFQVTAAATGHTKAPSSQIMAARCLDQLNRPAEALTALDGVAKLSTDKRYVSEAALWRPAFLLHAKKYAEALPAFKTLASECAGNANAPAVVLDGVQQLLDAGSAAEAVAVADLYLSTFAKAPDRSTVARMKSRALSALKRDADARTAAELALDEAEKLPKGDKRDQVDRPAALMRMAELSGANGVTFYEKIDKDHPTTPFAAPARYQLAFWAGEAGKLDDAQRHAEALLKELPKDQADTADLRAKALFAAAEFAYRKEDFPAAEKWLTEYLALPGLQKDPATGKAALANLRLGWCRFKKPDVAGAAKAATEGLSAKPDAELRTQLLYLHGLSGIPQDAAQPAPGLADFETLAKEAPQHELTAHAAYRAAQFLAASAPAKALTWLDRLIETPAFEKMPLRFDALELRARLRYEARQYAESLADAELLLKRAAPGPRAPAVRLLKAACLEALPGKTEAAAAAYEDLIKAGPSNAPELRQGLRRRAQLRFEAKQFAEAEKDLAVFLDGKTVTGDSEAELEAALLRAICRKEQNDAEGAKSQLEKLAALPLQGAPAFEVPFQLGHLTYVAGQNEAAAGWYRRALDAAQKTKGLPQDPIAAAWLNLAWSYRRADQLKEAEEAFGQLLAAAPDSPHANEARMQRAKLLAEKGNLESALPLWAEILKRAPDGELAESARYETAVTLAKGGRYADGAKAFAEFIAKHPQSKLLRDGLCGLGECSVQLKQTDAARDAFSKVLGTGGAEGELDDCGERAVLGLAEMALTGGDANQAKRLALRIMPGSKWFDAALYTCGRASENLAEPEKAIGYYRKLVSDCPKSPRLETAKERLKALGAP